MVCVCVCVQVSGSSLQQMHRRDAKTAQTFVGKYVQIVRLG